MSIVKVSATSIKYLLLFCLLRRAQTVQLEDSQLTKSNEKNELIVGGVECSSHVPYMASLQDEISKDVWAHFCDATIITSKHVLTAAHCLNLKLFEEHPDYLPGLHSDIAVIKILDTFAWTHAVQKLEFHSSKTVPANERCWLLGWGKTKERDLPLNLQCLNAMTLSDKECARSYSHATKKHICSSRGLGYGSCAGDSGGLVTNWDKNLLIGVMAEGPTLCGDGQPDISTRVSKFVKWIDKTVKI